MAVAHQGAARAIAALSERRNRVRALLVTRVLPYVWYAWRHAAGSAGEGYVEAREAEREYTIALRGAWTRANLTRLRRCFAAAAQSGKDVRLDMTAVSHVDSAFVGLAILLLGYLQQRGRRLAILPVPRSVRRVIEYCCASSFAMHELVVHPLDIDAGPLAGCSRPMKRARRALRLRARPPPLYRRACAAAPASGERLGAAPESLQFVYKLHGKPALAAARGSATCASTSRTAARSPPTPSPRGARWA